MSAVVDGASLPSVRGHSSDELKAIALNAAKAEKKLDWKPTVDLAEGPGGQFAGYAPLSNESRSHSSVHESGGLVPPKGYREERTSSALALP